MPPSSNASVFSINLARLQLQVDEAIKADDSQALLKAFELDSPKEYRGMIADALLTLASRGQAASLTALLPLALSVEPQAGHEALWKACWEGRVSSVHALVEHAHGVLRQRHAPPFFTAIARGHRDCVLALLPSCVNDWHQPENSTSSLNALMFAARTNQPHLLECLRAAGVDPRALNTQGESGLVAAIQGCSPDSVRFFLRFCDPRALSTRPKPTRAFDEARRALKCRTWLPPAFWACVDQLLPFEDQRTASLFVHRAPADALPQARARLQRVSLDRAIHTQQVVPPRDAMHIRSPVAPGPLASDPLMCDPLGSDPLGHPSGTGAAGIAPADSLQEEGSLSPAARTARRQKRL